MKKCKSVSQISNGYIKPLWNQWLHPEWPHRIVPSPIWNNNKHVVWVSNSLLKEPGAELTWKTSTILQLPSFTALFDGDEKWSQLHFKPNFFPFVPFTSKKLSVKPKGSFTTLNFHKIRGSLVSGVGILCHQLLPFVTGCSQILRERFLFF